MALALGILALMFMGFAGYTIALQRLFPLLLEPSHPPDGSPAHDRQAVVLLKLYIGKLNPAFALGMVVYMVASRAADWQDGVLMMLLGTLGGLLVSSTWLHPRSRSLLALMAAELAHQRDRYGKRGKADQVQAVEGLLARLTAIHREPG